MSCIKFPSSKSELSKTTNKENLTDYSAVNFQLISAAQQVFGEGNWSHAIISQTLDFVDYVNGKYQAGCASIVKVELKNGVFHEGIGYSSAEGSSKGSAVQKVRLSSFNDGLRKALMCFGSDIISKINKSSNSPTSPLPIQVSSEFLNKSKQMEISVPNDDAFDKNIPLSQTDALMNTVDIDHLFAMQDLKPNNVKILEKEIKIDIFKPSVSIEKERKVLVPNTLSNQKEIKIYANTGLGNIVDKSNKTNETCNLQNEIACELSKVGVPTVMTEEEMRLERKRKQREMQEEFKRKEEIKRMHCDVGCKPPNPRY